MHQTKNDYHILVVDDDAITCALLRDHLRVGGNKVTTVSSAAEAMVIIQDEPVQIIVADWMMPQISGLELLRWIRQQRLARPPHFVMLTANTGQEKLVEAFNAGVDDFLTKPFNDVELMARLQAWLRLVTLQDKATRLTDELRAANKLLVEIASRDDLTSLANRRAAMEHLHKFIQLSSRHGYPLTCALIDVDYFKRFNDLHGHATGDQVLKHIAGVLNRSVRGSDISCRIAGDEFLVILPSASLQDGTSWAERFTRALADEPFRYRELSLNVTVSIGLAHWVYSMTPDQLLEAADQQLYKAKHAGRAVVRSHD